MDGLRVHYRDLLHGHAYLLVMVFGVDFQVGHPFPQLRHAGCLGRTVGLALLRGHDLFLDSLFFVHQRLKLGGENLVIHVCQHLIQ